MTHQLELAPELEKRLQELARQRGEDANSYLRHVIEKTLAGPNSTVPDESDPVYLLSLPKAERDRIIEAQVALAAPIYEADLALPVEERELTAFTALNDDPILENYHVD